MKIACRLMLTGSENYFTIGKTQNILSTDLGLNHYNKLLNKIIFVKFIYDNTAAGEYTYYKKFHRNTS